MSESATDPIVAQCLKTAVDLIRTEWLANHAVEPLREDEFLYEFLGKPVVLAPGNAVTIGRDCLQAGLQRAKDLGMKFHRSQIPLPSKYRIRTDEELTESPPPMLVTEKSPKKTNVKVAKRPVRTTKKKRGKR